MVMVRRAGGLSAGTFFSVPLSEASSPPRHAVAGTHSVANTNLASATYGVATTRGVNTSKMAGASYELALRMGSTHPVELPQHMRSSEMLPQSMGSPLSVGSLRSPGRMVSPPPLRPPERLRSAAIGFTSEDPEERACRPGDAIVVLHDAELVRGAAQHDPLAEAELDDVPDGDVHRHERAVLAADALAHRDDLADESFDLRGAVSPSLSAGPTPALTLGQENNNVSGRWA